MDINKYNGVIPAFYACYDDNGNISPEPKNTPNGSFQRALRVFTLVVRQASASIRALKKERSHLRAL